MLCRPLVRFAFEKLGEFDVIFEKYSIKNSNQNPGLDGNRCNKEVR
jgi:hypothetical protein